MFALSLLLRSQHAISARLVPCVLDSHNAYACANKQLTTVCPKNCPVINLSIIKISKLISSAICLTNSTVGFRNLRFKSIYYFKINENILLQLFAV